MYRSFLSWRYLRHRPTNLIGMVGIFVAVAALILILSIMTGFLEETRRAVRGSLADLLIEPIEFQEPLSKQPGKIMAALEAKPEVSGSAAQLRYGAMVTLTGDDAGFSRALMRSATYGKLSAVELVGVDVRTPERLLAIGRQAAALVLGGVAYPTPIHDELNTTDFMGSLLRVGEERQEEVDAGILGGSHDPVPNPLMPFYGRASDAYFSVIPRPGVIVGEGLAAQLSLRRGEVVQLATAIPGGGPEGDIDVHNREFVITGVFKSSENEMNLGRIYLARSELADFLRTGSTFSQILVRLDDYKANGERLRDELRQELAQAHLITGGSRATMEVRTWEEFKGNLLGAIENERILMGIMLSLVMVVAGFTVFAILSMMVTEKRRDIGILCALGATRSGILHTFLWIAFWDALVGASLGGLVGVWAALRIDDIEHWLSRMLGYQIFNRDVYLFDHIPTVVMPSAVAIIVSGAFACALIFSAIPAWQAARLDPLEALRYE